MAAAATRGGRGFWGRLGQSRVGRWLLSVLQDYAAAAREAAQGARHRPAAAAATAAALAGGAACVSTVPTSQSFESAALEAAEKLLLLPPGLRNPSSDLHVQKLLRRRATGRLRYRDLVFLAVIYEDPGASGLALYPARCPHLRPGWRELPGLLWDVGFCGRWWVLSSRLRDCDVNEGEFRALPERLRRVGPWHLRSQRNEALFMEKFRPVVLTEEEEEEVGGEEGTGRGEGGEEGAAGASGAVGAP